MLVYAPVREEDLNALDRALREKEPADCSLDQRKVFDEKRAKVVAAFKARFNAPIDFLASVDEYRRLFSRKRPWLPALELLATAGCEGTQTIQRGLRVRDLCLANKEQEDSDPTDSANGKALRPLTRRLLLERFGIDSLILIGRELDIGIYSYRLYIWLSASMLFPLARTANAN